MVLKLFSTGKGILSFWRIFVFYFCFNLSIFPKLDLQCRNNNVVFITKDKISFRKKFCNENKIAFFAFKMELNNTFSFFLHNFFYSGWSKTFSEETTEI